MAKKPKGVLLIHIGNISPKRLAKFRKEWNELLKKPSNYIITKQQD